MIARLLQGRQASLFPAGECRSCRSAGCSRTWNDRRRGARPPASGAVRGAAAGARRRGADPATDARRKSGWNGNWPTHCQGFARDQGLEATARTASCSRHCPIGLVLLDLVQYARHVQDPRIKGNAGLRSTSKLRGLSCWPRGVPSGGWTWVPAAPINTAVQQWRAAIVERHGRARPPRTLAPPGLGAGCRDISPAETNTVIDRSRRTVARRFPGRHCPGERPGTFLLERLRRGRGSARPVCPRSPDLDRGARRVTRERFSHVGRHARRLARGRDGSSMTVIGLARPRRVVKLQGDAAGTTAVLCTALPQAALGPLRHSRLLRRP